jgi:signal recognition particle receptor subunit beta
MAFAASEQAGDRKALPVALKVLIAGGFGVGKTTLVGAVSEIRPLSTEELLSAAGTPVDRLTGVERKTTTTVALDFGRITIRDDLTVYLFGTPGQERFWFMWDELASGAIGAVILADTRRLADCFPSVDFFESRRIPFVLAVNCFDDAPRYRAEDVRSAVDLEPPIPVILCDARQRSSSRDVLIALVEHSLRMMPPVPRNGQPPQNGRQPQAPRPPQDGGPQRDAGPPQAGRQESQLPEADPPRGGD